MLYIFFLTFAFAHLHFEPAIVDFGQVQLFTQSSQQVLIRNTNIFALRFFGWGNDYTERFKFEDFTAKILHAGASQRFTTTVSCYGEDEFLNSTLLIKSEKGWSNITVIAHCTSTRKRKFQISPITGNLPFRFSFSRKVFFKSERKRPWKILSITTTNITGILNVDADKAKEYRSGVINVGALKASDLKNSLYGEIIVKTSVAVFVIPVKMLLFPLPDLTMSWQLLSCDEVILETPLIHPIDYVLVFTHNRTNSIQFSKTRTNEKQLWSGSFSKYCNLEIEADIFVHIRDGFITFKSVLNFANEKSLPTFDHDRTRFHPKCASSAHFSSATSKIVTMRDFGYVPIQNVSINPPANVNFWQNFLDYVMVDVSIPPNNPENAQLKIHTEIGDYLVPVSFVDGLHVLDECVSEISAYLDSSQSFSIPSHLQVVDIYNGVHSCSSLHGEFQNVSLTSCGNDFIITKHGELEEPIHLLVVTRSAIVLKITLQPTVDKTPTQLISDDLHNEIEESDVELHFTFREAVFGLLIFLNFGYTYYSREKRSKSTKSRKRKKKKKKAEPAVEKKVEVEVLKTKPVQAEETAVSADSSEKINEDSEEIPDCCKEKGVVVSKFEEVIKLEEVPQLSPIKNSDDDSDFLPCCCCEPNVEEDKSEEIEPLSCCGPSKTVNISKEEQAKLLTPINKSVQHTPIEKFLRLSDHSPDLRPLGLLRTECSCACENCHEIRVLMENKEKEKLLDPSNGGGTRFYFASDDEDAIDYPLVPTQPRVVWQSDYDQAHREIDEPYRMMGYDNVVTRLKGIQSSTEKCGCGCEGYHYNVQDMLAWLDLDMEQDHQH